MIWFSAALSPSGKSRDRRYKRQLKHAGTGARGCSSSHQQHDCSNEPWSCEASPCRRIQPKDRNQPQADQRGELIALAQRSPGSALAGRYQPGVEHARRPVELHQRQHSVDCGRNDDPPCQKPDTAFSGRRRRRVAGPKKQGETPPVASSCQTIGDGPATTGLRKLIATSNAAIHRFAPFLRLVSPALMSSFIELLSSRSRWHCDRRP